MYGIDTGSRNLEAVMARFAERQKGNVTRRQLLAAGFTATMIARRLRRGSLHPVFPGVYLVGHRAEPPLSRECAALLYCAPRALLGCRTAAGLWELPAPDPGAIEVIVVGRRRNSRPGIEAHFLATLAPGELRRREGLPLASPALTLLDLAGVVGADELDRALNEARVRRLFTDDELGVTLSAHPTRKGRRALARLLTAEESAFVTESEAERRCLRLMIAHGLKPDETQAWIAGHRVDFLYRAERLVVEFDGYRYHGTHRRFVEDRRRATELVAAGWQVFPLTWRDVTVDGDAAMSRLRRALERRRIELSRSDVTGTLDRETSR